MEHWQHLSAMDTKSIWQTFPAEQRAIILGSLASDNHSSNHLTKSMSHATPPTFLFAPHHVLFHEVSPDASDLVNTVAINEAPGSNMPDDADDTLLVHIRCTLWSKHGPNHMGRIYHWVTYARYGLLPCKRIPLLILLMHQSWDNSWR